MVHDENALWRICQARSPGLLNLRFNQSRFIEQNGGQNRSMFDKKSLDAMFSELRDAYELEPEWEEIQRDAHLGIARADGGVDLGNIDPRVAEVLKKHNPS